MTFWIRPGTAAAAAPGGVADDLRTNWATDPHPVATSGALSSNWFRTSPTGTTTTLAAAAGPGQDGRAGIARLGRTGTPTAGSLELAYREMTPLPEAVGTNGAQYMVSAYVRSATTTFAVVQGLVSYDGPTVWFPVYTAPSMSLQANVWHRISWLASADALDAIAVGIAITFNAFTPNLPVTLDMGCVLIERVPDLAPYFDGGTPAALPWSYRFRGAPTRSVAYLTTYLGETEVPLILEYSGAMNTRHTTLEVLNRADPIPVLGPGGLRNGTMDLFGLDLGTVRGWAALFNAGTVGVRDTEYPDLSMVCVAPRCTINPVDDKVRSRPWVLSVEFAEVKP